MAIDTGILDGGNLEKLEALGNRHVLEIVERYAKLCKPKKIVVFTDSQEDRQKLKELPLAGGEEKKLAAAGHTIHYDGYLDQGRDRENTRVLIKKDGRMSKAIVTQEREAGLKEIFGIMDGIMEGKDMFVGFFCLGPLDSKFSIPALQLTDSAYVLHSEDMLYRPGYAQFKKPNGSKGLFHFIHSAGELEDGASRNTDKRRVIIDLEEERVFSVNTQYAGNSVGLKKLALRLAISKANQEDWLTEHMFIMGARPEGRNRTTYFTGAYPSACGKTSTAMIPGQSIIGDDIAFLRINGMGEARAVNIERGIFGIIEDVNPKDDPLLYETITTPREIIFSNILVKDGKAYWAGMGKEIPEDGTNHSGAWHKGKKDPKGNEIPPSHKNARYTLRISELENADPRAEDPEGVPVSGIIYGGRDSDTSVPVVQSLSWSHGVFTGSALESETTAATLGKTGQRKHNPMANLDFLVIPLGLYIRKHLEFGDRLDKQPLIFATNYFLKKDGRYLNEKLDKKTWLMWMEGRVHGEYGAIETPVGYLPRYEDLKGLFRQIFKREYTREQYEQQFSIRASRYLEKLDRVEEIYKAEDGVPEEFKKHLTQQRERLKEAREKYGADEISPFKFLN